MKKVKKPRVIYALPLYTKIFSLLVYCFILNVTMFWLTNNIIRIGFIDYFDERQKVDGFIETFAIISTGIFNVFASVIAVVFTFILNYVLFIITTVILE